MRLSCTVKMKTDRKMKLTEYGSAASVPLSKEDERSAALARRAQQGDYDEGNYSMHMLFAFFLSLGWLELKLTECIR